MKKISDTGFKPAGTIKPYPAFRLFHLYFSPWALSLSNKLKDLHIKKIHLCGLGESLGLKLSGKPHSDLGNFDKHG